MSADRNLYDDPEVCPEHGTEIIPKHTLGSDHDDEGRKVSVEVWECSEGERLDVLVPWQEED